MNYLELRNSFKERLYFGVEEVGISLGISDKSARVLCSRLVRKGLFIKIKRDFYILRERWENLKYNDFLQLANILQVPSYISCMTALTFYNISTQVQRSFFESVALKRTKVFNPDNTVFTYYKIRKELYFGFERKNGIFIAVKEKAFLDALYLYSFGKYRFDISSLDMEKLEKKKVLEILERYPEKTQKTFRKIWKN